MRHMFVINRLPRIFSFIVFYVVAHTCVAKGVYQTEQEFLVEVFGEAPIVSAIWLKGDVKSKIQDIFQRKRVGLRQKYWQRDNTTAWVLNEIGKEMPITFGVVVSDQGLADIKVLEYRESRGGEVRHLFFRKQFFSAQLNQKDKLDKSIDGISGATLSVKAMKKVAAAALYLHQQVVDDQKNKK